MIHTTFGVYNNGDMGKVNGVPSEELAGHIKYNLTFRPGRAFFVDGKCLNVGYLGYERCDQLEKDLAHLKADKMNAPWG